MLLTPCSVWHTVYICTFVGEQNVTAYPIVGLLVDEKYSMSITLRKPLVTFFPVPVTPRTMGTVNKSMQKCSPWATRLQATQTMNRLF